MSVTTGPYPIAGGGSLRISLPRGTLVVSAVAVGNLTPAAISVTIGGSSKYVLPGGTDLFACNSGQSYVGVTSLGTPTDAGSITTTWFDPADEPGRYPYAGAITKITTTGTITAKITGPVTISGGQLSGASGVANQPVSSQITGAQFGSGTDGTVTLTASATLTRDMHYQALVIDAGVTLTTAGYRVLAKVAVTIDGTVTNSAIGATAGAAGTLEGGAAGVTASISTGKAGAESPGLAAPSATLTGGAGGHAHATSTGTTTTHTAAGGTAGASPPGIPTASVLSDKEVSGGASGGAAVGNGTPAHLSTAKSGAGAGVIYICTPTIKGTGALKVTGGDGSYTLATPTNSAAAAGGGGGGLLILAAYTIHISTSQLSLSGGASAEHTGVAYAGTPGRTVLLATAA